MVVVFPAPLGPRKPKMVPSWIVRVRLFTAVSAPKVRVKFCVFIIAWIVILSDLCCKVYFTFCNISFTVIRYANTQPQKNANTKLIGLMNQFHCPLMLVLRVYRIVFCVPNVAAGCRYINRLLYWYVHFAH
jgi:hypothetical protein